MVVERARFTQAWRLPRRLLHSGASLLFCLVFVVREFLFLPTPLVTLLSVSPGVLAMWALAGFVACAQLAAHRKGASGLADTVIYHVRYGVSKGAGLVSH